jgi:hypothetical protein
MIRRAFLTLCLAAFAAAGSATTLDDQARFLAGFSGSDPTISALEKEESWKVHSSEFQKAWQDLEVKQLTPIRQWMPAMLGHIHRDPSPLFYLFSGPDMLYAQAYYPEASTYILCGQEPVGRIPDVASLSSATRASALSNLRKSLNTILNYSFFRTLDMITDLRATQLNGTLPIMMVFLSRAGCKLDQVELVHLDETGALSATETKVPGVHVTFRGAHGRKQDLYYFSSDLSDSGIQYRPNFIRFCQSKGRGNSLIKAASYLLHNGNFGSARQFLLGQCNHIVQDDTGIPMRYMLKANWLVSIFGNYIGPIEMFRGYEQSDIRAAFRTLGAPPMPFRMGYQWRVGNCAMLVGTSPLAVPKAIAID